MSVPDVDTRPSSQRSLEPNLDIRQLTSPTSPLNTIAADKRNTFQRNYSLVVILLINILERFAYYGLLANFILYLNKQPFFWESYNASMISFIFIGLTYLISVIGGWIADSLLGKYVTICLSFVLYIAGYAAYPIMAYSDDKIPNFCHFSSNDTLNPFIINSNTTSFQPVTDRTIIEEPCSWVVILSIVVISVGVGFIKTNIGPFGADQVTSKGPNTVFKYFNWLYWCINIGSLSSLSGLAYMQQSESFFEGYTIPWGCLVLAFILFLTAKPCYYEREKEPSIVANIFRVIFDAFKSLRRKKNHSKNEKPFIEPDDPYEGEDYSNSYDVTVYDTTKYDSAVSFLDNAKIRFGGSFDENIVNDVKTLRTIVILFALLIPYWILYFQIETTFLVQGLHMKLFTGQNDNQKSFDIPAASLSIANQIIIIFLIPLLDGFIYPWIKKRGFDMNTRIRMIIGMIFAALSVTLAGVVETIRLKIVLNNSTNDNDVVQIIDNTTYIAANFSILWQIPQYALVGVGEVFCSIAGLYFAYTAAPKSMQSLIMGLFNLFMGVGSFLGSLILYAFHGLIYSGKSPDDINCNHCHLDYYYYFLAGLQLISIIVFYIIDKKYSLTKLGGDKTGSKQDDNNLPKIPSLADQLRSNRLKIDIFNRLSNSSINNMLDDE